MYMQLFASVASASLVLTNIPATPKNINMRDGIRQIVCGDIITGQMWSGTMVHVAPNRYISADHVASQGAICVDSNTGTRMDIVYNDPANDFAILDTNKPLDKAIFKVSCKPFKSDQTYYAYGYGNGKPLKMVPLVAQNWYTDLTFKVSGVVQYHLRYMTGQLLHGMSGGPIVDKKWNIYGINNAADEKVPLSWSRELKDTVLCK